MSRFNFGELPQINTAMEAYYRVAADAVREDLFGIYYIPDSLQTPQYAAQVINGGALTAERVGARFDRVSTFREAGVIGERLFGQVALQRAGVDVAQLEHVRNIIEADARAGDYSIGILPVSEDTPPLPADWPLNRLVGSEYETAVITTPTGLRVAACDRVDVIRVDTDNGRQETAYWLQFIKRFRDSALHGEAALTLVDDAIARNAA